MTHDSPPNDPERLVQLGWAHLAAQKPFAAWSCWRRASLLAPGDRRPMEALEALERSPELPARAREPIRLRSPRSEEDRHRWTSAYADRDLSDISTARSVFDSLVSENIRDVAAWFNFGACSAWLGENRSALDSLDIAIRHGATIDRESAVEAALISEILRQGAGAADQADDLSYALQFDRLPANWPADPLAPFRERGEVLGRPTVEGQPQAEEWLDRPMLEPDDVGGIDDVPSVAAYVIRSDRSFRISGPDREALERTWDRLTELWGEPDHEPNWSATPLRLGLLDAAVWAVRPPPLDPEVQAFLAGEAVERYYTTVWIHQPRHGLSDHTPAEAAQRIGDDPNLAVRLEAVVRLREQLAARPVARALYGGWNSDSLRRLLGLPLNHAQPDA